MTTQTRENASVSPSSAPLLLPGEGPSGRIRLIFVDDDDNYREAIGAEFVEQGFDVVEFSAGDAAADYFAEGNSADIILLDWKLPKQSGPDLLRQLRRRGVLIPVVFLTGLAAETYEEVALDCGALDFVD